MPERPKELIGKSPDAELDGTWHEPGMPGEDASLRYRIVFQGDEVAIAIGKLLVKGNYGVTHGVSLEGNYRDITFVMQAPQGETLLMPGKYRLEAGELSLQIESDPPDRGMGRAPLTLTLRKV
jgi:hypothetical protein